MKVAALVRADALRRRAADPLAARARRGDPLARALHADRARAGAGDRGGLGQGCSASRWRWARSSPGWSSGGRSSACGRRPKRCRCATPSPCCSSSRSGCCSTRGTCRVAGPRRRPLAVILLGKPLAALAVVRMLGQPLRTAASVAVALTQIGEFSFILAAAGRSMGILDDAAVNTIVAAAIVLDHAQPAVLPAGAADRAPLRRFIAEAPVPGLGGPPAPVAGPRRWSRSRPGRDRRLWAGGPDTRPAAAREPVRGRRHRAEPPDRPAARRQGIAAVYGDAAHRETLEQAGVREPWRWSSAARRPPAPPSRSAWPAS